MYFFKLFLKYPLSSAIVFFFKDSLLVLCINQKKKKKKTGGGLVLACGQYSPDTCSICSRISSEIGFNLGEESKM